MATAAYNDVKVRPGDVLRLWRAAYLEFRDTLSQGVTPPVSNAEGWGHCPQFNNLQSLLLYNHHFKGYCQKTHSMPLCN